MLKSERNNALAGKAATAALALALAAGLALPGASAIAETSGGDCLKNAMTR